MMQHRKADERGHVRFDWLDTWHSFSFGDYYDPAHMGFRSLRVINDDTIAGAGGFPTHPHKNMEIITWVLDGALEHKDSLGNGSVIRPGDAQYMSAGTGIRHSEFNPSATDSVHLLQLWIMPAAPGGVPLYDQKHFTPEQRANRLCLIASADGRDGSIAIRQDASVHALSLSAQTRVEYSPQAGRGQWIQMARGRAMVNGLLLGAGDGLAIEDEAQLIITGTEEPGELLLFDLA
jgi:redox-sensitive bicupin YhaK (pirin superfamily)